MDVSNGVAPPAPAPPQLNTTFNGQNTIYVNNLNERKEFQIIIFLLHLIDLLFFQV